MKNVYSGFLKKFDSFDSIKLNIFLCVVKSDMISLITAPTPSVEESRNYL